MNTPKQRLNSEVSGRVITGQAKALGQKFMKSRTAIGVAIGVTSAIVGGCAGIGAKLGYDAYRKAHTSNADPIA